MTNEILYNKISIVKKYKDNFNINVMVNETIYLHMISLKKIILFYYFIDLCYILNCSNLKEKRIINLYCLLIYRVLIYKFFNVYD